jgi:class 3 adenylate cyclase
MSAPPVSLSRDQLVERSGVAPEIVDRLVELAILAPDDRDRFGPGDVYRVRLIHACQEAGLGADAIARAVDNGQLSLSYMDLPHYRFAALGTKTYRELAEEQAVSVDLALDVVASLGYTRPSPEDRIREDDEPIFPLVRLAATMLGPDALMRTTRVYVDALRRIAEAEGTLFEKNIVGSLQEQGLDFRQAMEAANRFSAEVTPLQELLILTLYRRQQERRWTESTVEAIERVVEEMGLYRRPERPPAFAFVDLAGYTQITDERGDEAGARLAADLAGMVDEVATAHGGTPVKWLGDGVMISFHEPEPAVRATLLMVERAPGVGLPAHAGVAAGPVVVQDGDYFGRTVNVAARIAAGASAGQTLVSRLVAELAQGSGLEFRDLGPVELKGLPDPIAVFEALDSS